MFSSTMQILEAYSSSPTSSVYSRFDREDGPHNPRFSVALLQAENSSERCTKLLPNSPSSGYRTSSSSQSATNSPASSVTSAFSDFSRSRRGSHKEIRRRRSPIDSEPRPKDLKLISSNGFTSLSNIDPSIHTISKALPAEPRSPSPEEPPPPPPPKNVQTKPIAQKMDGALQNTVDGQILNPETVKGWRKDNRTLETGLIITASAMRLPPAPPPLKLVVPRGKQSTTGLPEMTGNATAKNFNFPNPRQGIRRPMHQKSISTISQNKPLPPGPPFLVHPFSQDPEMRSSLATEDSKRLESHVPVIEAMPTRSHFQSESSTAPNVFGPVVSDSVNYRPLYLLQEGSDPASHELSSLPKTASGAVGQPDYLPAQTQSVDLSQSPQQDPFRHRLNPAVSSVESSLTNASLSSPFSQPHLLAGPGLRNESLTLPQRQKLMTSQPKQAANLDLQQPDPPQLGITEVRNPLIASKLTSGHFYCYAQHKQLVPSSNASAPVLCMACDHDSDRMWKCGWCCLRICDVCKDVMGTVNGDLRRLLDERKNGKAEIVTIRMSATDMGMERSETPMSMKNRNVPNRSGTPLSLRTRNLPNRSETPLSLRTRNVPDRSETPMSLRARNIPDLSEAVPKQSDWSVPERTESAMGFSTRLSPEINESSLGSRARITPDRSRSNSPMNSGVRSQPNGSDTPMSLRIGRPVNRSEPSAGLRNGMGIPDFDSLVPIFYPGTDLGLGLRGGRGMPGQRIVV